MYVSSKCFGRNFFSVLPIFNGVICFKLFLKISFGLHNTLFSRTSCTLVVQNFILKPSKNLEGGTSESLRVEGKEFGGNVKGDETKKYPGVLHPSPIPNLSMPPIWLPLTTAFVIYWQYSE